MKKFFLVIILSMFFLSCGSEKIDLKNEEYINGYFVILNKNGTMNKIKYPIENIIIRNDAVFKDLKFYDKKNRLIGEFEKIDDSVYINFLVKIKPKNFFDEKVIMKDIKKTNTVFIYPRGMGKGIIIRNITENGNVDTEIIGNKSRTKLLSGRIIEEEKFEDKYIIRHYNENGELEKETVKYLPEYMRLKNKAE